jgi:predicted naringenin-chalcone synthase
VGRHEAGDRHAIIAAKDRTTMSLAILGMGTAVPAHQVAQQAGATIAARLINADPDQTAVLAELHHQTQINSRYMVFGPDIVRDILEGTNSTGSVWCRPGPSGLGPDTAERMARYVEQALPLATEASEGALDEAGVTASAITHLVTVSCTGFAAPGFDLGLIGTLGLSPTVERTHVGFMGCHGALNGLRVARAYTAADPEARVLLCAAELCSIHYHYAWNPKRLVGNALFADGAATIVGVPPQAGPDSAWQASANGSCLFPGSEHAMTWTIGNHGFDMTLSAKVPGLIADHLRPWFEPWLRGHGLAIGDVASWAIHPGGPRIISAVESALHVDRSQTWASREVLAQFGNMSSPTVLFILKRLRDADAPRPCVAIGFGPGLVAEAALFR